MKKLYWISFLLILILLFNSCISTLASEDLVNNTINAANEKITEGKIQAAIDLYSGILKNKKSEKLSYNKLLLLIQQNNYEEADTFAAESFKDYPEYLCFLRARVQIAINQNNSKKALELGNTLLEISPYDKITINTILDLLDKDKELQYNKALELYKSGYTEENVLNILANYNEDFISIRDYYL